MIMNTISAILLLLLLLLVLLLLLLLLLLLPVLLQLLIIIIITELRTLPNETKADLLRQVASKSKLQRPKNVNPSSDRKLRNET